METTGEEPKSRSERFLPDSFVSGPGVARGSPGSTSAGLAESDRMAGDRVLPDSEAALIAGPVSGADVARVLLEALLSATDPEQVRASLTRLVAYVLTQGGTVEPFTIAVLSRMRDGIAIADARTLFQGQEKIAQSCADARVQMGGAVSVPGR